MFNAYEWINLAFRWAHVFAAILWVGTTYYFTWLDGQLRRAQAAGKTVWMVHSGGFYTVEKQKTLGVPPGELHWFRFEALATWITGFTLLIVVYYLGGLLVDPIDAPVSERAAMVIGLATLAGGWIVYDLLVRTPLARASAAFGIVGFALIVAVAAMLGRVMSARAAYMHVGALLGTIMMLNVWMRILPAQRRMVAAAARGEPLPADAGASAKERSKHNTFIVLPTVFLMISNHFPTATYGNRHAVVVLGTLVLVGWCAAALLRRA